MVYAFIIQNLLPGPCSVLYSCVFGQDLPDRDPSEEQLSARNDRKDQLITLAQQVQSEYNFRTRVTNRSYEHDMQILMSEGKLPDFELGFIRLCKGEIFSNEKVAVWMGALNCGFTLVCEKLENRAVAEATLKILIKYLHEHCKVFTQGTDIVLKPDRVTMVTQTILPGGHLVPANHRVLRGMEKSLEVKMKS